MTNNTPALNIHTRTIDKGWVLWPPSNQPQMAKQVAMTSTHAMAPVSCQDGSELQKGPFARVTNMSQFSVRAIWRKRISSKFPYSWAIPPFVPPTYNVVRAIQVPAARTMPLYHVSKLAPRVAL